MSGLLKNNLTNKLSIIQNINFFTVHFITGYLHFNFITGYLHFITGYLLCTFYYWIPTFYYRIHFVLRAIEARYVWYFFYQQILPMKTRKVWILKIYSWTLCVRVVAEGEDRLGIIRDAILENTPLSPELPAPILTSQKNWSVLRRKA